MSTLLFPTPTTPQTKISEQPSRPQAKTAEKLDVILDFAQPATTARTRTAPPHILFSPMHYEAGYKYPLLVWLHPAGENEHQLIRIMPQISVRNYVAVAPRGFPSAAASAPPPILDLSVAGILHRPKEVYDWQNTHRRTEIEQRIFDCIAVAQMRCSISPDKVFIAGFGSGGTTALQLAAQNPNRFAGAASFGKNSMPHSSSDCRILPNWRTTRNLSIFLGADAAAARETYRMMELFHTAGMATEAREYPDTTQLTEEMLRDLNRWMMEIICNTAGKRI
ncbi:MAG: dienelactone hydrolase family protein [Planctomycetaceae bacterium]|nr:dienelactone hydrolase family protein [Planctomycetaceae bacterium]